MRRFVFERYVDHSDFSGTGTVMEGVEFSDGRVALTWLSEWPSIVIWPDIDMAVTVHGHGGDTVLRWLDEEE